MTIENLERRLRSIEDRNKRVELEKAWETSYARKSLILLFTYLSISIYMYAIRIENPWLNAVVPTLGFFLSTLTLPWFKNWWIKQK